MANTQSAKKKLRQDKKKASLNSAYKRRYKEAVKSLSSLDKKSKKDTSKTVSLIDKAVKKGVIHKNKAARLKSRLTKKQSSKNG